MSQAVVDFIPIEKVAPSPDNPRKDVGDVKELAESVRAQGIINPVIVVSTNGGYQLVAGERRWAAAKVAGLSVIPAIVHSTLDEKTRAEIALVENLQREDLAPMEEAQAYQRLIDFGYSQHQLAERVGRNQSHISKRLSLLALPPRAKKAVDAGSIGVADAVVLTKIADDPKMVDAVLEARREAETTGELASFSVVEEVEDLVDARHRQEQYDELVTRAKERAQKDGIKFVAMKANQHGHIELPKGAKFIERGWGSVEMKPKAHAKEKCHALTVIPAKFGGQQPEIAYVCTKPSNHPEAKEPSEKREETRRRKANEHQKALSAATTARRTFIREKLVPKRLPKPDLVERIIRGFITASHRGALQIACQLLELEIPREKNDWGGTSPAPEKALTDYAKEGERQLLQVGLAVMLASPEESASRSWGDWKSLKDHFAFLTKYGYRRTDAERLQLEGKGPR